MKRSVLLFVLMANLLILNCLEVFADPDVRIRTDHIGAGLVKVSMQEIKTKTKVMIEKGSVKYYYDLRDGEEAFPLQMGQGDYTVAVLENTVENLYKVVHKETLRADMEEENAVYLNSVQMVRWDTGMESIKLAENLAQGKKGSLEIVQAIYGYIVRNIAYDSQKIYTVDKTYIPDIDQVLKAGKGMCYDYSVLFAAMLRSRGIPAKLVMGYKDDIKEYHAWNEAYLDGEWMVIDPTYDAWAFKNGTSCDMDKNPALYKKEKEY